MFTNPPRDTVTTHYKFAGADFSYCSDTCTTLPNYYYDVYEYTGNLNSVSNTTSTPETSTTTPYSETTSVASCGEYVYKTIPIYSTITVTDKEYRTEPLYGDVCYKSTKTRNIINKGKTQLKWSFYNDTTLLNNGWVYTGNKEEKYKSIENEKIVEKSCIFYNDGSIEEGTKQDAIKAIKEIAVERNITHPDQLRKMMNKDIIYTMTEKEFIQRYNGFLPQKELDTEPVKDIIEDSSDENKAEETIESPEENQETDSATNTDENNDIEVYEEEYDGSSYNDFTSDYDDSIEDNELYLQEDSKFTKFISKIKEKTKEKVNNNSKAIKAIAGVLAVTVGFLGCNYLLKRCSKKGEITDSNITDVTTDLTYNETTKDDVSTSYIVQSNDFYDDYTLSELLDVTNNSFQKSAMINVSSALNGFNGYFAKNYLESGHDIKAALSFDEIVALQ